jgi:hypothetical protein
MMLDMFDEDVIVWDWFLFESPVVVTFNDTISDKERVVQAYIRASIININSDYYSRLGDEVYSIVHAIIQFQTDARGQGLGCLKSQVVAVLGSYAQECVRQSPFNKLYWLEAHQV